MKQPKVTLKEWAASEINPPPCDETLRRWVRGCRIYPPPEKIGRAYYVERSAKYVDPTKSYGA